jgi:iron(III) transport system permease protein
MRPRIGTWAALSALVAVAVLPVAYMLGASFVADGRLSLENWRHVLATGRQWVLLKGSLGLAGAAAGLAVLLGAPLAFLLQRTDLPLRRAFRVLYPAPLFIPPFLLTITWLYLLGPKGTLTNLLGRLLGRADGPVLMQGFWGAAAALALSWYPIVTLLASVGFRSVQASEEEAARLHGSGFQVFRRVTLPLALPSIVSGALFVFLFALNSYSVPNLLSLQGVYTIEIVTRGTDYGSKDFGQVTATAAPFLLISIALLVCARWLAGGRRLAPVGGGRGAPPRDFALGRSRAPALAFVLLVLGLSVAAPVGTFAAKAWPFRVARQVFAEARPELLHTLGIAGAATAFALLLGVPLARAAASARPGRLGAAARFLTLLPFAFPGAALALGFARVWNRGEVFGVPSPFVAWLSDLVYPTPAILVLAYGARFLPFASRALEHAFERVTPSLEEAAAVAGASRLRTLGTVVLPLSARGIAAGAALFFALSVGEMELGSLLSPHGWGVITPRILNKFHFLYEDWVGAASLIVLAIGLAPVLLVALWPRAEEGRA